MQKKVKCFIFIISKNRAVISPSRIQPQVFLNPMWFFCLLLKKIYRQPLSKHFLLQMPLWRKKNIELSLSIPQSTFVLIRKIAHALEGFTGWIRIRLILPRIRNPALQSDNFVLSSAPRHPRRFQICAVSPLVYICAFAIRSCTVRGVHWVGG